MKVFFIKIVLFITLFFVFDKLLFVVENHSAKIQVDKRLELLINGKINKDIIILGSSRGARSLIASQIEKSTGLSCYNLSYLGSNIEFHEFLFKTLIKYNKKPKTILLVVDDYAELLACTAINYREDKLYPLVKYQYIKNELIKRGLKNKYLSNLFILHNLNRDSFSMRYEKFNENDTILDCGSMPIYYQAKNVDWNYKNSEKYPKENELEIKIKSFKKILDSSIKNNIKLIIVLPPNYYKLNNDFIKRMEGFTSKNVELYCYDTLNSKYKSKSFYYDSGHLKRNGAQIFTNDIVNYLKE